MRRSRLSLLLIAGMLVLGVEKSLADSSNDLAVIVNKKTTVLALTARDLRGILLGEKERWPNGQKVFAASLPTDLPETRFVLKQICGMSEGDYKRYFMQLAFQGKSISPPKILRTPDAIKALVSSTPGAVGIIHAREVDESVNVLSLDGVNPGTANYKLTMTQ